MISSGLTGAAPSIRTRGLIDTGASDVCIDYRIAQQLGLRQIDQQDVGIVGATVPAAIYSGVLAVPDLSFSDRLPLYALKVRRPTHEVLLGRSFLRSFIVTFNGPLGTFHFASPSDYTLHDFEE